jgi:hypothetical protein
MLIVSFVVMTRTGPRPAGEVRDQGGGGRGGAPGQSTRASTLSLNTGFKPARRFGDAMKGTECAFSIGAGT